MAGIYKLRLGDGTILGVDQDGLRTWQLDDKAMVQEAGSGRWRRLREVLGELAVARQAAAIVAPPASAPAPAPQPAAPVAAAPVVSPPAPAPSAPAPAPRPVAPVAASPAPAPAPQPAAAAPRTVAAAAPVAAPAARREPDHGQPPPPAEDFVFTTLADSIDPGTLKSKSPRTVVPVEDLPVIPLKPLDAVAAPPAARHVPGHGQPAPPAEPFVFTTLADSIDAGTRKSKSPRTVVPVEDLPVIPLKPLDEDDLPELPELEPVAPVAAAPAGPSMPPTLDAVVRGVAGVVEGLPEALERSREVAAPAARAILASAAATPALMKRHARLAAGAIAAVALVAVATVAIVKGPAWLGSGSDAPGVSPMAAALLPPRPSQAAEAPPLPKDVEAAVATLPHLSVETIQLLRSRGATDPARIFRQAYEAAHYGAPGLPEVEAQELRTLKSAVAATLRSRDRQRVRAYDRMSRSAHLLVDEDARVMAIFARGVRALPADRRGRLQELFGKAVAAYFQPRRPTASGPAAAP